MTSIQTDLPSADKPQTRATPAPCTLMMTPETPSALTRAFAGLCEADDEEKLSGRLFLADVALAAEDSERITAAIAGRLSTETLYADLSHEIRHAMDGIKTDLTASIRESLAALAAPGSHPVAVPEVVIEGPACEEVAGEHLSEISRGDIELELSLANLEAAIGDIEMLVEPEAPAPLPETAPLSEPVGNPQEAPRERSRVRGFIDGLRRAGERFFSKEVL